MILESIRMFYLIQRENVSIKRIFNKIERIAL